MTIILTRKRLTWFLAATVFLAVLATAGCAGLGAKGDGPRAPRSGASKGRTSRVDPASAWHADRPGEEGEFFEPAPQTVNVFGELDGVERAPVRPVGNGGFQQHTLVDEGEDSDVSVDPAGKWLVFASTRHNEHSDLYLQRVDGTSVTQLTSDGSDDAFPAFSPDGKQIAFSSTRSGAWQIFLMDIDGRNVTQVTSGLMQCVHPSFSPDGTKLVYSCLGGRSNQWELWTVDLQTNEKRMVGYGLFPAWSPRKDADRIAFQRSRQRGSRWFSLWTLDLVNGEGRRVTEVAVSPNAAIVSPAWSPDGEKLAFTTIVEPSKSADGRPKGQQDVWTVNADGSDRQRLTGGSGTNVSPWWSADERIYFVSDRGGHECVWSVQTDGDGRMLAKNAGGHGAPSQDPEEKTNPRPAEAPAADAHGDAHH